jgi:uncharacterized membrane protein YuzA (DUF378 family)
VTQPRRPSSQPRGARLPQRGAASPRDQVLARRRLALIGLVAAVPVTLLAAILTGSVVLLAVNIVVGLALAAYIALLLQIKQAQRRAHQPPRRRPVDEDEMRVQPPRR